MSGWSSDRVTQKDIIFSLLLSSGASERERETTRKEEEEVNGSYDAATEVQQGKEEKEREMKEKMGLGVNLYPISANGPARQCVHLQCTCGSST